MADTQLIFRVCEKKSVKINTTVYTRSPKIK